MKTTKCYTLNLSSRSRAVAMLFQTLSFTTSGLGRITRESCVHNLLIFHQIPPCSSSYTKTQLPWTSNNSSCLLSEDFCLGTQKSTMGCLSFTTQRNPRSVTAGHSLARPLKTSRLQNHSFDFCVPHHAYASITAWLLKTKALYSKLVNHHLPRLQVLWHVRAPPSSLCNNEAVTLSSNKPDDS